MQEQGPYAVFGGNGDPQGGWLDIQGIYRTIGDARLTIFIPVADGSVRVYGWGHIVDLSTRQIVEEWGRWTSP